MESKFNRVLSISTLYPEKSEKLPQTGIIKLPRKYEKVRQISNGSFTSVFCIKDRGKIGTIYAAKFMKHKIKNSKFPFRMPERPTSVHEHHIYV